MERARRILRRALWFPEHPIARLRQPLAAHEPNYGVKYSSFGCYDIRDYNAPQLHPVVAPQVSHFRQVPLRTSVKFMHSGQASPS